METPSSTRRVTRSQALAASVSSKKFEESEKAEKSRKGNEQERSALFDITNDSPIVGVAMGNSETPSSAISKKRAKINTQNNYTKTPGSGEALLRGQVKNLLQKVEEEGEISKLSVEYRPFLHLKRILNSPNGILAPTPANTPHFNLSGNGLPTVSPSTVVEEKFLISQMIYGTIDGMKEEIESEESMITRSLFLDFTEKSDSLESENKEKMSATEDDDDSSVWSIQANASSIRDEEDYDDDEESVDEICEGMSKMSVNGGAKFTGKHTRFVYNSDGELERVVVEKEEDGSVGESAAVEGVVHLKGWPSPKGIHLRFTEEVN